jgi:hypothetical protein
MLRAESGELLIARNPSPFTGKFALLRSRTSGKRAALFYISRDGDPERLLACAPDGKLDIDWVAEESTCRFIVQSTAPGQPILNLLENKIE